MTGLLAVMLVFIVLGVLIAFFSSFLNRDLRKLVMEAKTIVRNRLTNRKCESLSVLLDRCSAQGIDYEKIEFLLNQLSLLIGIDTAENKFNCEDVLGDLLRVKKNELIKFEHTWNKRGFREYIEVFSGDLLVLLNKFIKPADATRLLRQLNIENANEDQVLDVIMNMTVETFLMTFAPYINKTR